MEEIFTNLKNHVAFSLLHGFMLLEKDDGQGERVISVPHATIFYLNRVILRYKHLQLFRLYKYLIANMKLEMMKLLFR